MSNFNNYSGSYIQCSTASLKDVEDLNVTPDFVSFEEEAKLMKEVEFAFRRTKYDYAHWDGVSDYTL